MERLRLKYSFISALWLCIFAVTGCSEAYPSLEYEDNKDVIENQEASSKTPIMLFVQKPSLFSITTRGTGAFDPNEPNFEAKRKNMLLHIFAFHNSQDVNMTESMNSVHGGTSEPDYENCLIDNGVNSGNLYWIGRPARLNSDNEGIEILKDKETKEPEQLYYSSVHQDYGYNFFAYYIDDFEPNSTNTTRTQNEIYHNIEIDGSQDIMCGYSPKLEIEDIMNDLGYNVRDDDGNISKAEAQKMYDNILSDTEQNNINNILSYGYSTYSAHRGINPTIDVKHQLTRLKFTAYPGDGRSENITITGIEVKTITQGKLVVASTDLSKVGLTFRDDQPLSSIFLKEKSIDGIEGNQPLRQDFYNIVMTAEDKKLPNNKWMERTATPIGDCLLVPPSETIRLILHYKEKYQISENGDEYGIRYPKVVYDIKAPTEKQNIEESTGLYKFKSGYSYDIKIAVYGLQPIEIVAQMEGWKEGGDVDLDEDDFFDGPLE